MNLVNDLVNRPLAPAPPEAPTDPVSFLRWAEGRKGRYEWVGGRVVMMTGASKNHGVVTLRIGALLLSRLDPEKYQVCVADLGVRTGAGVRFPDIVVDVYAPGTGADLSATAPVLIVEVLSPSSLALDRVEKAAEYMTIESLGAYALVAQDRPQAWIWSRGPGGWPEEPLMVQGLDALLPVPIVGLALPLADVFRGVEPTEGSPLA